MNFVLLVDEQQVKDACHRFPLFRPDYIPKSTFAPRIPPLANLREDNDDQVTQQPATTYFDCGDRYVLVCDTDDSALAILHQKFPFPGSPITMVALVVTRLSGLHRLLKFLKRFMVSVRSQTTNLALSLQNMVVHFVNGVTLQDVEEALQVH